MYNHIGEVLGYTDNNSDNKANRENRSQGPEPGWGKRKIGRWLPSEAQASWSLCLIATNSSSECVGKEEQRESNGDVPVGNELWFFLSGFRTEIGFI